MQFCVPCAIMVLQKDETDFMKGRVIEMTEAELKENFVQVRTPDKERIARITKELIGGNRTAAEFAQAVGLTPSMISRIMNGNYKKPLTEDILVKLVSDCSEDQNEKLQSLILANGMISKEQQERRNGRDGYRSRMSEMRDREISIQNIVTSELFARGVTVRKIPRFDYSERLQDSKFFSRVVSYSFVIAMVDIEDPYEWGFIVAPQIFDEDDAERDRRFIFQRLIERYSYLFLMDAWEPEFLSNKKTSFVFLDQILFDMFVDTMQDAKLHNRMSAILVDIEKGEVLKEKSLICSEFQDMDSPFSTPIIKDEPEDRDKYNFFFFFDPDDKEGGEH